MFKNAKLLKSVTIALACALVISVALFVGIAYVGAAANTVTLYVSNSGDNTNGSDEGSAFTTIVDATKYANGLGLKPGTEVKILVVDRVSVKSNSLTSQVLDTEGKPVPVTIEGYGFDGDEGNRPEIYCEWYDTSNNAAYRQWIHLGSDVTVRNVKILSKLQDEYNAEGASGGIKNRFCTRYLYCGGFYGVFDNVIFTTEAPDVIKWELCADKYASKNVPVQGTGHSGFTLMNGNYSNCEIQVSNYPTSNYDLEVKIENATIAPMKLLTSTNTETDTVRAQKAKSITMTFGDGAIVNKNSSGVSIYTTYVSKAANAGYYLVPDGITVNFEEGCLIKGSVLPISDVTNKTVVSDHTFNYKGGTFEGDVLSGFGGSVQGTVTNNVSGGDFKTSFYGGAKMLTGTVKNNVSGGKIATFYGGLGVTKTNTVAITNTITGDAEIGTFYGGGIKATYEGSIHNIVDSDDVTVKNYYGGVASSSSYTHDYALTNDISGGTFTSNFVSAWYHGKGYSATYTTGKVVNNISGGTFKCDFHSGLNGFVTAVENNVSGGTFEKTVYLGSKLTTGYISIKNNISGGIFKDTVYGGCKGREKTSGIAQSIENKLSNGVVIPTFYAGSYDGPIKAFDENAPVGVTTVIENATITTFYGGSNANEISGNVSTTVKDGVITSYNGGSKTGTVTGSIKNVINGGTFEGTVAPGSGASLAIDPAGSVLPLTFKGAVAAANDGVTVTVYGSDKPINLGKSAVIYADALAGTKNVVFCQIAEWVNGQTYVSLPGGTDMSRVFTVNMTSTVPGTATIKTVSGSEAVVGASGTGTVIDAVTPTLNGYAFVLENQLKLKFYVPASQINAYLELAGAWDYAVSLDGIEIASDTLTSAPSSVPGANGVDCFVFETDLGIAANDFDKTLTLTMAGNSVPFEKTVYELIEGGISASSDADMVALLKALHNYGTEASNVFNGTKNEIKYKDITYTGSYNSAPSRTSAEDGFEFFATSLSLEDKVSLNFYLKLANGTAANQVTYKVTGKNGALLDASKISYKPVTGVKEYNVIVSVELNVTEMAETYKLIACLSDGSEVATCTNSIASSCAGYIATENKFAPVSKALLAYIEKAVAAAL